MDTLLINENLVVKFQFWHEGRLQTGMRFRNHLFYCHAVLDSDQRYQSFSLAESLTQEGKEVVITVVDSQYTIWVNLRSVSRVARSQNAVQPLTRSLTRQGMRLGNVTGNAQYSLWEQLRGTTMRFA